MKLILENWQKFVNEQEAQENLSEEEMEEAKRGDFYAGARGSLGDNAIQGIRRDFTKAINTKNIETIQKAINKYANDLNSNKIPYAKFDKLDSSIQKILVNYAKNRTVLAQKEIEVLQAAALADETDDTSDNQQVEQEQEKLEQQTNQIDQQAEQEVAQEEEKGSKEEQVQQQINTLAPEIAASPNPEQALENATEEIAQNNDITNPDDVQQIENNLAAAAQEEADLREPSEEENEPNDPNLVDPDDESLQGLVAAFDNFKDNFYVQKTLRQQAVIVNTLLASLKKIADQEEKEFVRAVRKASEVSPAEPQRGEITEAATKSNIKGFKTASRNFQRALMASRKLVSQAQSSTTSGQRIGKGHRVKLIKFATATQQTIISLNKALNNILFPKAEVTGTLNESTAGDKYLEMLEAIEQIYTDIIEGELIQIVQKMRDKSALQWPEIRPIVATALKQLGTIKKFFPSLVPFEGGEVEAEALSSRYLDAIKDLDVDFSDIQTLPDSIGTPAEKSVLVSFQRKLINFSVNIQKIFGVKGLKPQEDSAEAKGIDTSDVQDDAEPGEEDTVPSDDFEELKARFKDNAFYKSLRSDDDRNAILAFAKAFIDLGRKTVAESILKYEGDYYEEMTQALKSIKDTTIRNKIIKIFQEEGAIGSFIEMLGLPKIADEEDEPNEPIIIDSMFKLNRFIELKVFRDPKVKQAKNKLKLTAENEGNIKKLIAYSSFFFSPPEEEGAVVAEEQVKSYGQAVVVGIGVEREKLADFKTTINKYDTEFVTWLNGWAAGEDDRKPLVLAFIKTIKEFMDINPIKIKMGFARLTKLKTGPTFLEFVVEYLKKSEAFKELSPDAKELIVKKIISMDEDLKDLNTKLLNEAIDERTIKRIINTIGSEMPSGTSTDQIRAVLEPLADLADKYQKGELETLDDYKEESGPELIPTLSSPETEEPNPEEPSEEETESSEVETEEGESLTIDNIRKILKNRKALKNNVVKLVPWLEANKDKITHRTNKEHTQVSSVELDGTDVKIVFTNPSDPEDNWPIVWDFDLPKDHKNFLKNVYFEGEPFLPSLFQRAKKTFRKVFKEEDSELQEKIAEKLIPLVEKIMREQNG
jgi:hypothetical protein